MQEQIVRVMREAVEAARRSGAMEPGPIPEVVLEPISGLAEADYTCDVAVQLAQGSDRKPRAIAEQIVEHLSRNPGPITRAIVSPTGTVSLAVAPTWHSEAVCHARAQGERYGRSNEGGGRAVHVEFVSANPNAPLHVGHGRAAVLGDTIARLLERAGWSVTREYYVNDVTNYEQMAALGRAVLACYRRLLGHEAGSSSDLDQGRYIGAIAAALLESEGPRYENSPEAEALPFFIEAASSAVLASHRADLQRLGVSHDVWFFEKSLHTSGTLARALDLLKASGYTYESDGALWLRSTAFGDDSDRVLVRATGTVTYLAADAAYHLDKFERGFERVINVWGADHQAYVPRTRAALAALGIDPARLEVVTYQDVCVYKNGEPLQLSRAPAESLALADLIDAIGRDSARVGFLLQPPERRLDLDLDTLNVRNPNNPAFSLRQAYQQILASLTAARAAGVRVPPPSTPLIPLSDPAERALARAIASYPQVVTTAANAKAPHRLLHYADALGKAFQVFANCCPLSGDRVPKEVAETRAALTGATRDVFHSALQILGCEAGDSNGAR